MSQTASAPCPYDWFFFDFGGVIAEEGFVNGLRSLARAEGIDPDFMLQTGIETVFGTGFVVGRTDEAAFWRELREKTGLRAGNDHCRETILNGFVLRPWMLEIVRRLRRSGRKCAILSDQVGWLDILEERHGFFQHFDRVVNSFYQGKSKRDSSLFTDVLEAVGAQAEHALFVDDSEGNIQRASEQGLATILYRSKNDFLHRLQRLCPIPEDP
ncbi:HAD family hydrolase [Desulfovermiculus halophilus]|uniref:HAD family hydrolase n=1 Tax=Desulfovermiculus halophilus TaxID=339722 RepID=UPI000486B888|nr:HAD family phosphatase [Desulfovermiculus halophilus]